MPPPDDTSGSTGTYPPRPVWVTFGSLMTMAQPGLLLEWQQVEDPKARGGSRWEALVVHAVGGADGLPWHVETGWRRAESLQPMDPGEPPDPRDEARPSSSSSSSTRPVWVTFGSAMVTPLPGLLLQWRPVPEARAQRGHQWEALVIHGTGGTMGLPWRIEMGWLRADSVRPMHPRDPPRPRST